MKRKDEDLIESIMQQIADRLPDVNIYQKVYAEPVLGGMILTAYVNVVRFSRIATDYYQGSGHCRSSQIFFKEIINGYLCSASLQEFGKTSNFCHDRKRHEEKLSECQIEMRGVVGKKSGAFRRNQY